MTNVRLNQPTYRLWPREKKASNGAVISTVRLRNDTTVAAISIAPAKSIAPGRFSPKKILKKTFL
jgi:hypothetical protein